ncbi:MAG: 4Fe-4S binding protein [Rikenellaceae bacterium]
MAKVVGKIEIDKERCKGCGVCVEVCPTKAISLSKFVNDKGYHYCELSAADSCVGCANCGLTCPDGCIVVYRKKID